jgi:hypothetical protein
VNLTIRMEVLRGRIGHALALVANVSLLSNLRSRESLGLALAPGEHLSLVALLRVWEMSVLLRCDSKYVDSIMRVGPATRQRSRESVKRRC